MLILLSLIRSKFPAPPQDRKKNERHLADPRDLLDKAKRMTIKLQDDERRLKVM